MESEPTGILKLVAWLVGGAVAIVGAAVAIVRGRSTTVYTPLANGQKVMLEGLRRDVDLLMLKDEKMGDRINGLERSMAVVMDRLPKRDLP